MNLADVLADLLANAVWVWPLIARQVRGILDELRRHLLHRQYMIHQAGCNRAAEDGVVLGGFQGLGDGHAAVFFDRLQTARAVRAGPREHDAHGILPAVMRQGTEETVDGRALAARLAGRRPAPARHC